MTKYLNKLTIRSALALTALVAISVIFGAITDDKDSATAAGTVPIETLGSETLDTDADDDGIDDADDECPNDPEIFNGFEDEDGCPDEAPVVQEDPEPALDTDADDDGIDDAGDACPSDPETVNDFEDGDGCPDQAPAGTVPNEDPDNDGDGYAASEDCDDADASVHPGAE
jgi:hypothetical protein